ncbi:MAG: hypothetical protein AAGA75_00015 [Cyanobacteria bacterium P01_E01_bin.6]
MDKHHLELLLRNPDRQVWHYEERVPCNFIQIDKVGSNLLVEYPFDIDGCFRFLPVDCAEIVPRVGDICWPLAGLAITFFQGDERKISSIDWFAERKIHSIDSSGAMSIPLLKLPLRCFYFIGVAR